MIRYGGEIEMVCSICGRTFFDTSYNTKRICLKCQDDGVNMVTYKIYYGKDKTLELTEEEALEIYRYLELKLTGFTRQNFRDQIKVKNCTAENCTGILWNHDSEW